MPWTAKDAHRFKKGLTAKQARQWAHVANSALKRCKDEGGDTSDCEQSAIRQASASAGRQKAKEVMDNININIEENDMTEEKAVYSVDNVPSEEKCLGDVPTSRWTGAKSYSELDESVAAEEKAAEVQDYLEYFVPIARNILYDSKITEKSSAIEALGKELAGKIGGVLSEKADGTEDEEKGMAEKAKWSAATMNDLPDSCFLYIEPGGKKDEDGKTTPRGKRHLPYKNKSGEVDLPHLRNAISRLEQSATGKGWLSEDLRNKLLARARRILENSKKELPIVSVIKSILSGDKAKSEENLSEFSQDNGIFVWKNKKGNWMWFARYSNNYRDRDIPPEIISEKSHLRFADMVDKGVAPYPELWLWHNPEWNVGKADWHAYDGGFAMAAGHFYDGCEGVAEIMSKQAEHLLVSHGMPKTSIKRDTQDNSVIVEHETREISPLPQWAAANTLTGFVAFQKEADMAINDEKRQVLIEELGFPSILLGEIESRNRIDGEKAKEIGLENKETTTPDDKEKVAAEDKEQVEQVTTEQVTEQPPETIVEEPKAEAEVSVEGANTSGEVKEQSTDYPTRQEVAESVANVVVPKLEELSKQIDSLVERLGTVEGKVKEVTKEDEEKIVQVASLTPTASLAALLKKSIIGVEATKVGENDALARSKPKEKEFVNDVPPVGVAQIPFIHDILADEKGKKKR